MTASELTERKRTALLEKDATELALEKALFGDQTGFLDSINEVASTERQLTLQTIKSQGSITGSDDGAEDQLMADVPDDELFFMDAGTELDPAVAQDLRDQKLEGGEEEDREENARMPVWFDSDDERFTVSLASNTRLRKLRDTEDDDIVDGPEYIRRLRRQYEMLHPMPDWVRYARKKRRLSKNNDQTSDDGDSDVSIDNSSADVKPLADLLRSAVSLTRTDQPSTGGSTTRKLRPEVIDVQRLNDIASSGPSSIDVIQFHPQYPLLLTAGPSSTINLYHVSPESQNPNPILTSLHVKGTPITTAAFSFEPADLKTAGSNATSAQDTKIYLSSRRRYFHTWSLNTGTLTRISRPLLQSHKKELSKPKKKELPTCERMVVSPTNDHVGIIANTGSNGGTFHVLSTATHQPIAQVRVESLNGIADARFYSDGSGVTIIGKNGEVTEYNIAAKRVIARWTDEAGVGITTFALGGHLASSVTSNKKIREAGQLGPDRWIAIGSTSGIVNIYDRSTIIKLLTDVPEDSGTTRQSTTTLRPTPTKTLDNLTTPISHLVFSSNAQVLVLASSWKNNALRLVHLPSCSVYRNWPTQRTPLGRISAVAMSPDGGYLVVGNEQGKVRCWAVRD